MSTNKTPNLALHSWVGTDYVKRTEFNENFDKIDTEVQAVKTGKVSNSEKGTVNGVATLGANGKVTPAQLVDATTSAKGVVQLTDSVTSTSTTTAATAAAAKAAYDRAIAAEANSSGASIPKTEKGAANGVAALDDTQFITGKGLKLTENYKQQVFNFTFADGIPNQKVNLIFTQALGTFELTIGSTFVNVHAAGRITKRYDGIWPIDGGVHESALAYTEVTGRLKNFISIGDPVWDSVSKYWKIQIEAKGTAGNGFSLLVTSLSGSGATKFTLSEVYTAAPPTLPVPVQVIPDDTVTQSGYLIQKHRLTTPSGTSVNLPSGYNLNDLTVNGFYDGTNFVNAPNASTDWFYIESYVHSNNQFGYRFQRATMLGGAGGGDTSTFERIQVNGTWGNWVVATGSSVFKTNGTVNVDYNQYTKPGIYQIYGVITANNPPLSAHWGILNVYAGSQGYVMQEATQTTAPYGKWYRTRTETEWGPWLNVAVQNRAAIFDGVDARSAQNFKTPTDPPSTYPGGESVFFVNNIAGWPDLYGTVVSFRGHNSAGANAVSQYFYPYVNKAPVKYRYSVIASDTWGEWETVFTSASSLVARSSDTISFGNASGPITTAEFVALLTSYGAFNTQGYWAARGSWIYAGNKHISDSGFGLIHLAGTFVEVIGTATEYTIKLTTSLQNGVDANTTNSEFTYASNGAGYASGWRRDLNTSNTSGLFGVGQTVGNANTLVYNGTYVVAASWAGSLWAGADGANQGYLTHTSWNADNSYAVQTFMPINTVDIGRNGMWYRRKIAGAWGTWTRVYSAENDVGIFKERGGIPSGSDLNDYNGNGSYMLLGDPWNYLHAPPIQSYYVFTVSRAQGIGGFVKQTATQVFGSFEYYRTRTDGGTWSPWVEVMTSESGNSFVSRSLPSSGEDLNNKTALGMYTLGASNDYVNGPGLDWCVLNVYRNAGGYMVQEATNVGTYTPQKRFRTRTEAGYWSRWTDVVTTDSTGKIPGVAANRAVAKSVYLDTTSTKTIATYTAGISTTIVTVKTSLMTNALRTAAIEIWYKDDLGNSRTYTVLPATQMPAGDYQFISPTFSCAANSIISVVAATPSTGGNAWVSAVITEEG